MNFSGDKTSFRFFALLGDERIEIEDYLRTEVYPATANDFSQILKTRGLRIRSAVKQYNETTTALYQWIQPGVIEMTPIGEVTIRRDVVGLREKLTNEIEGPQSWLRGVPAGLVWCGGPVTQAHIQQGHQHRQ